MGRDNFYMEGFRFFEKEIRESSEYMDWLEEYQSDHDVISSSYYGLEENKEDRMNLSKIPFLYDFVDNYAKRNYLHPVEVEDGNYYAINDRNHRYCIGVRYEDGVDYYCVSNCKEEEEINFQDILQNKKLPNAIWIDFYLEELEAYVERLLDREVPDSAIQSRTEETIRKIKVKRLEENKKSI